jgi:hypothetical protein
MSPSFFGLAEGGVLFTLKEVSFCDFTIQNAHFSRKKKRPF